MSTKNSEKRERREQAAELMRAHKRHERRRTLTIVGGAVAVGFTIVGVAAFSLIRAKDAREAEAATAQRPIDGVEEFEGLTNNHVTTAQNYPQTPSVGGDHAATWTNCGVYTEPVNAETTTHSLEHGAVWIGYDPSLPNDQVKTLADLGAANPYVLVSPVEGVPSPVTLSAWGKQLQVDSADDPRVAVFARKYQKSPDAPEPGAPCTGGTAGM